MQRTPPIQAKTHSPRAGLPVDRRLDQVLNAREAHACQGLVGHRHPLARWHGSPFLIAATSTSAIMTDKSANKTGQENNKADKAASAPAGCLMATATSLPTKPTAASTSSTGSTAATATLRAVSH